MASSFGWMTIPWVVRLMMDLVYSPKKERGIFLIFKVFWIAQPDNNVVGKIAVLIKRHLYQSAQGIWH